MAKKKDKTKRDKGKAVVRSADQNAAVKRARAKAARDAITKAHAERLAQIANLMIAGHSIESIGLAVGAEPSEIEDWIKTDMSAFVRTQPALRQFARNFVTAKYNSLLEAVWDVAVTPGHHDQFAAQDRAQRILAQMGRLHGAEAPTQTEIKIDAAPEAVERMVASLAAGHGLGYDEQIFDDDDVIDADVVEDEDDG